jgi:hypothetical protein
VSVLSNGGGRYQKYLSTLTPEEVHIFSHFVESYVTCRIAGEPELREIAQESEESEHKVSVQLVDEFFEVFTSIARKLTPPVPRNN